MADIEFELAVACCRWSCFGGSADGIRSLAGRVNWGRFLHIIQRHRVQRLANSALRSNAIVPPSPFDEGIFVDARAVTEQNLRSAGECARLLDAFSTAGVDLLFLKGLTLSALAYDDPFLKMSIDIDLLVQRDAAAKAAEILEVLGYRLIAPAIEPSSRAFFEWHGRRKESNWYNPDTGLTVDFHTALSDNRALIPSIGMGSPRQMVTVAQWAFPTLETKDLFAYLSVHGTWSAWYRLKWITDVTALIHRSGDGAAERFYRHAISSGAGRGPAQALLLAHQVLGLELAPSLRNDLESDPVNRLLATIAMREMRHNRAPNERRLGTLPLHLTRPLILPGWGFKYSEAKRQLHDVVERLTLYA